ncbi:MAG: MMPL family transporter, partial [Planctomycetota bacterium]
SNPQLQGGDSTDASSSSGDRKPLEGSDKMEQKSDEVLGVDRVFATVLSDLLRAKKFVGTHRRGRVPKHLIQWHDPRAKPLGDKATSEEWGGMLAQFDCVVVLADHPDYQMDFIRRHGKNVVDARDHGFIPGQEKTAKEQDKAIQATYTGVVPIVYKTQRTLLHSLIQSIGWAFAMIAAVMMILLRPTKTHLPNVRGGLISMVPNVFPVILIFGAMGHMNIVVDIGTMMTASVAMGVAVDDTIHFLTWFRRGIREGLDRNSAIKKAYSHVAVAMTQTTIIGGLGLSVFALSTFTPTQRFGTMMLTLLAAALFGDLILLPALLAGPLGRFLCPQQTKAVRPAPPASVDTETKESEAPDVLPIAPPTQGETSSISGRREKRDSMIRRGSSR